MAGGLMQIWQIRFHNLTPFLFRWNHLIGKTSDFRLRICCIASLYQYIKLTEYSSSY